MGNLIFSNSFVDVANAKIFARSEASGYVKANVMDRWNLERSYRADDKTTNDYVLTFDFSATQSLVAVFLYCNFSKVKIQGHGSDSWGTPSYPGTDLTVSVNSITRRGHICIPLTGFNYQWLRIFIPTDAVAIGPYTTKWEINTVCFLSSWTTLSMNMSYGYGQIGRHFYGTSVNERIKTANFIRWEGKIAFGDRLRSSGTELWNFNAMDMSEPFFLYENRDNTSEAYLCVRDDSFESTEFAYEAIAGNTIAVKEAYRIDR